MNPGLGLGTGKSLALHDRGRIRMGERPILIPIFLSTPLQLSQNLNMVISFHFRSVQVGNVHDDPSAE